LTYFAPLLNGSLEFPPEQVLLFHHQGDIPPFCVDSRRSLAAGQQDIGAPPTDRTNRHRKIAQRVIDSNVAKTCEVNGAEDYEGPEILCCADACAEIVRSFAGRARRTCLITKTCGAGGRRTSS
jgi:hypothetical protein